MKAPYIHTDNIHNMTASRQVVPLIIDLVKPKSVLDVGCGTGTWLKAFEERGIDDYLGVDGDFLDRSQLYIPHEKFVARDLCKVWTVNRKFDLVISLEVAEHLPESVADMYIDTLVGHTNGKIIFSAAIPGQGGQNHLNEQWPEYWQLKFAKHGYYFHDAVRPLIWNNEKVDWWYRQNIFLVSKEATHTLREISRVHPVQFVTRIENEKRSMQSLLDGKQGLRVSISIFMKALKFKLQRLLRQE